MAYVFEFSSIVGQDLGNEHWVSISGLLQGTQAELDLVAGISESYQSPCYKLPDIFIPSSATGDPSFSRVSPTLIAFTSYRKIYDAADARYGCGCFANLTIDFAAVGANGGQLHGNQWTGILNCHAGTTTTTTPHPMTTTTTSTTTPRPTTSTSYTTPTAPPTTRTTPPPTTSTTSRPPTTTTPPPRPCSPRCIAAGIFLIAISISALISTAAFCAEPWFVAVQAAAITAAIAWFLLYCGECCLYPFLFLGAVLGVVATLIASYWLGWPNCWYSGLAFLLGFVAAGQAIRRKCGQQ